MSEGYFLQALTIDREPQYRREGGMDLTALGELARARGQLDSAERFFQQAIAIGREVQDLRGEGVDLRLLAHIATARGERDQAEAFYRQSLSIANEGHGGLAIAGAKAGLAEFLLRQREEGCRLLAEAARSYDELGFAEQAGRIQVTAQLLGYADE